MGTSTLVIKRVIYEVVMISNVKEKKISSVSLLW